MMKKLSFCLLVLICVVTAAPASAQLFPNPFASAGHSAADDSAQFDVDIPDSFAVDPALTNELFYRDPAVSEWSSVTMTELYNACSLYTYSTTIEVNTSSSFLEWYNRSENDTAVVTGSPKNDGDDFPVPMNAQADLGADPVGDTEGAAGSFLDITHCYASYSDTKFYCRIDNVSGGFPTSSGFSFHLYSVGIIDPDASDSIAYALLYASVPFVLDPGLFAVDPVDSSFSRIGDITTDISGNSLSMSCDLSDLTSQPEWSDWPPPSGFIGVAPVTATQTLTSMTANDIGKLVVYIPESNMADFLFNQAPVIDLASVIATDSGSVHVEIEYSDPDGHVAVMRNFHLGAGTVGMIACEKDYLSGTMFEASVSVDSTAWYPYYFEFSDGVEVVTTDLDSVWVEVTMPYLPGDADGSGAVDIDDVVFLISYIFSAGPPPDPIESGDADCSGEIDIDDVVYLIAYIFTGGPAPCE